MRARTFLPKDCEVPKRPNRYSTPVALRCTLCRTTFSRNLEACRRRIALHPPERACSTYLFSFKLVGACAMTTKVLDLLSWHFPTRKTQRFGRLSLCPQGISPFKSANFVFVVVSPSPIGCSTSSCLLESVAAQGCVAATLSPVALHTHNAVNWELGKNTSRFPCTLRAVSCAMRIRERKGTPKNFCDKEFAELSGELSGAICLETLGLLGKGR